MPSRHGTIRERASEPVAAAVVRSLVQSVFCLGVWPQTLYLGRTATSATETTTTAFAFVRLKASSSLPSKCAVLHVSCLRLDLALRDKSSDSKVLFWPSSFWIRSVGGGGRSTHYTEAVIYFVLHPHEYKCVVTSSWPVALPACRVPSAEYVRPAADGPLPYYTPLTWLGPAPSGPLCPASALAVLALAALASLHCQCLFQVSYMQA